MAIDIKETIGSSFSGVDFSSSSIMGSIGWLIAIIVFGVMAGLIAFFIVYRKKFDKKVVIFENIAGSWQPTKKYRAAAIKISETGDTCFYLAGLRQHIPTPTAQMGPKTYWLAKGKDDQLRNFGLTDLDKTLEKMDVHFFDTDMRYASSGLMKHLKDRYDQPNFWQKYGTMVIGIVFLILFIVGVWLWFDKFLQMQSLINSGMESSQIVLEKVEQVMAGLDNVCSGSGIR